MEVLAAFIREHSHEQWPPPERGNDALPPRLTRPDVQAGVTVIGRRNSRHDHDRIALSDVELPCAELTYMDLAGANLSRAFLLRVNLTGTNLTGANLTTDSAARHQPVR